MRVRALVLNSVAAPAAPGGAQPHLELVELEQVTVTAASEGGQQAALLGTPLRAGPCGGVRLRWDAHALRGWVQGWGRRVTDQRGVRPPGGAGHREPASPSHPW